MGLSNLKANNYLNFLEDLSKIIISSTENIKVRQLAAILFRNSALDKGYGTSWSEISSEIISTHLHLFIDLINTPHKEFQLAI
mmetsp:Transcript_20814/g.18439  ORF Transcript_20814/g.18439 Transcript_20814/m.18439 type:complete len:83 (+) Transcript_20814:77-325(+)